MLLDVVGLESSVCGSRLGDTIPPSPNLSTDIAQTMSATDSYGEIGVCQLQPSGHTPHLGCRIY